MRRRVILLVALLFAPVVAGGDSFGANPAGQI